MNKIILCLTITTFMSSVACAGELVWKNSGKEKTVHFNNNARLLNVFDSIKLDGDVNWESAQIENEKSVSEITKNKEELDKKTHDLELLWLNDGRKQKELTALRVLLRDINAITIAGAIKSELEPDRIRVKLEYNLPLVGRYKLYTNKDFTHVYINGLINTNQLTTLKDGYFVSDYIDKTKLNDCADNNEVYVISARHGWKKVKIAYWNGDKIEPYPGETIFVGFNSDLLPDEFKELNDMIANYLVNRMPL